jgi:integrase/recombinase XerD
MATRASAMRIYDASGARLYLSAAERDAFKKAADNGPRLVRTLCLTLLYTGCRISEAIELTGDRVDFQDKTLRFRSLKKRQVDGKPPAIFRAVPIPDWLLDMLDLVHAIREKKYKGRLWPWKRRQAFDHVKRVMKAANIAGPQASPKGLRHGFGIWCQERHVPPGMIQKWMGHAQLSTTAIYTNASGGEEREIAQRLWN